MHDVTIVKFEDLRFVLVSCQACPVQVRMDLGEKFVPTRDRGAFMFTVCPSCRKPFDSAVQPAVNQFYEAYQRLAGVEKAVSFVVEEGTK